MGKWFCSPPKNQPLHLNKFVVCKHVQQRNDYWMVYDATGVIHGDMALYSRNTEIHFVSVANFRNSQSANFFLFLSNMLLCIPNNHPNSISKIIFIFIKWKSFDIVAKPKPQYTIVNDVLPLYCNLACILMFRQCSSVSFIPKLCASAPTICTYKHGGITVRAQMELCVCYITSGPLRIYCTCLLLHEYRIIA